LIQEEFLMVVKTHRGEIKAEFRRYPRVPLKVRVSYQFRKKGEPEKVVASRSLAEDLGTQGLAMRSHQDMRVGQILTLTMFIPPPARREDLSDARVVPVHECLPVAILARAVWCKRLEEQKYLIGIQFLDIEPQDRHALKSFLVDYRLDDQDSPLYT